MRKGISCLVLAVGMVVSSVGCVAAPVQAGIGVWTQSSEGTYGGDVRALAEPRPRSLSDAPWDGNVKVNDDPGTEIQRYPDIAVDSSGNAYAVWEDYRDGNYDIYFSYRPAGGIWGPNVKVNDDTGTAVQGFPAIAVDSSGNAYAVWEDERNGDKDIYFSYRPAGGIWGPNVKVSDDPGTTDQGTPAIAADSSGNAYAVWEDARNPNGDIYFSYRPAGGIWGPNVRVDDDPGMTTPGMPAIAVDSSGNAYAVWHDYRNDDSDIYFSYRPAGGIWSPNVRVNDEPGAYISYPAIAVDPSGNAYAVWHDYRNLSDLDIYFSYRPTGGSWSANVKVNDDPGTTHQGYPAIAADSSGNAYAVWTDGRNDDGDIYFSYRAGALAIHIYLPLILKNH